MLVLSRKKMERIRLRTTSGEDIWLTIVDILSGNKVRLGIEAPQSVSILRSELLEVPTVPEAPC